tara:strand:- start:6 stop:152 length:147 start_codon:yes stop_codon:yes gene_type:complete
LTNRLGKSVNEETKDNTIANAVNSPNKIVGKKFDKERIEKPAAIVVAV